MSTIRLKCTNCENDFDKDLGEYNRRLWKLPGNTNFFCCRKCSATYTNKVAPGGNKNPNFSQNLNTDKKTHRIYPELVSYYMQRCVRDSRFDNMELDKRLEFANHLVDIWELQQHKCTITGILLALRDKKGNCTESNTFKIASIDRIDSNIPYQIGNVHWVSYAVNLAKNTTSLNEFVQNFKEVVLNMT